eukprot:CAMPEP_0173401746 /NCGR_PEP_ID=MMETSP1356-20130122/51851_1 /TAXON_ID=77927 ORGANISM="Hemiselmis virescens, Strain PCC157" /NCGR_SAMPLE_ID=MMETSP1356 /ASSEMBLY_ACC=CAM_ASM_000847 /LENGTH=93 /DNA_ID=CAMNT_0014361961 /DNA_START=51 /DNA_END=329 /DNA_ORIENTATION=+
MKETRGLYRRMLLEANLYPSAEEADKACPTIEEAKERLADLYLAAAEKSLTKELEKGCADLPPERWPRAVQVTEGSVILERCRVSSEAGNGVY